MTTIEHEKLPVGAKQDGDKEGHGMIVRGGRGEAAKGGRLGERRVRE